MFRRTAIAASAFVVGMLLSFSARATEVSAVAPEVSALPSFYERLVGARVLVESRDGVLYVGTVTRAEAATLSVEIGGHVVTSIPCGEIRHITIVKPSAQVSDLVHAGARIRLRRIDGSNLEGNVLGEIAAGAGSEWTSGGFALEVDSVEVHVRWQDVAEITSVAERNRYRGIRTLALVSPSAVVETMGKDIAPDARESERLAATLHASLVARGYGVVSADQPYANTIAAALDEPDAAAVSRRLPPEYVRAIAQSADADAIVVLRLHVYRNSSSRKVANAGCFALRAGCLVAGALTRNMSLLETEAPFPKRPARLSVVVADGRGGTVILFRARDVADGATNESVTRDLLLSLPSMDADGDEAPAVAASSEAEDARGPDVAPGIAIAERYRRDGAASAEKVSVKSWFIGGIFCWPDPGSSHVRPPLGENVPPLYREDFNAGYERRLQERRADAVRRARPVKTTCGALVVVGSIAVGVLAALSSQH